MAGNLKNRLEPIDVFDHKVQSAEIIKHLNYLEDGLYDFNDVSMDYIKK